MDHATRAVPAFLVALVLMAGLGGAAQAAPSLSLVWSGTTGTGTTGGAVIDAQPGDTLTLSVLMNVDAQGLLAWQFSLFGSGVTALSGTECPAGTVAGSFSNPADGFCSTGVTLMTAIQVGVSVSGSDIQQYEGHSASGPDGSLPQPMYVGRGVFLVTGVPFIEASGSAEDASFVAHDLSAATVPEPGTLGLLCLGLAGLGLTKGRR